MKVLVIESGGHEQIVDRFLEVFPIHQDVVILGRHDRCHWFSSEIADNYPLETATRPFFWYRASQLVSEVAQVIIFTPPEYGSGMFHQGELLSFLWFVKRYHTKITLIVRNTNLWQGNDVPSRIRAFCLRYLKRRLAFEYNQISKSLQMCEQSVALPVSVFRAKPLEWSEHLIISFSGRVSRNLRDLTLFCKALRFLSCDEKETIRWQIPSPVDRAEFDYLQSMLPRGIKFINVNRNRADYVNSLLCSQLLIAPLAETRGYGVTKGTGAFGDALYANRKVLVPRFSCRNEEFEGVAYYYETAEDLANWLRAGIRAFHAQDESFFVIAPQASERFSAINIYDQYLRFVS